MDTTKLNETLTTLGQEFRRLNAELRELRQLPKTTGEVHDLITSLAFAADDRAAHFNRFPRPEAGNGGDCYLSSTADRETVAQDWSRCMKGFDEAVNRLVAYARAERDRGPDQVTLSP